MNVLKRLFGGGPKPLSTPLANTSKPLAPLSDLAPPNPGVSYKIDVDVSTSSTEPSTWTVKGMCPVCGRWQYLREGTDVQHCGARLVNVERVSQGYTRPSNAPAGGYASDGWDVKGMCVVCGTWVYLHETQAQAHCGMPLSNVVLRKDQEEQERRVEEQERQVEEELRRAEEELRVNVLEIRGNVLQIAQHHMPTLLRKYRRTHVIDDYGIGKTRAGSESCGILSSGS